jgi:hypothetical protein
LTLQFRQSRDGTLKVLFDKQVVGRVTHTPDGRLCVHDIRDSTQDKIYATPDQALAHFMHFDWRSVLGRSSLVTLESRVIRRNTHLTKRWAFY